MKQVLTEQDFQAAAAALNCEVAAIKAVCQVEAPKGGFNSDESPVTLFEGHQFYKYTKGKFAVTNPTLCFSPWTTKHYGRTWQAEQARLQEAMKLDRTAALMSTSWGRFQIMGFNFALCGCKTVQQFINRMYKSEGEQLLAFIDYVKSVGLADELQQKRWADFARKYNGPEYWKNKYDEKLAAAYAKHKLNG